MLFHYIARPTDSFWCALVIQVLTLSCAELRFFHVAHFACNWGLDSPWATACFQIFHEKKVAAMLITATISLNSACAVC